MRAIPEPCDTICSRTKTDHTDAVAIAQAAMRSRHRRHVRPDGPNVALRLLSDRRTDLVRSRTSAVCRLHRFLRELISGGARRSLSAEHAFDLLTAMRVDNVADQMRVEIAMELIDDIARLDSRSTRSPSASTPSSQHQAPR